MMGFVELGLGRMELPRPRRVPSCCSDDTLRSRYTVSGMKVYLLVFQPPLAMFADIVAVKVCVYFEYSIRSYSLGSIVQYRYALC
jgi:hypothetical protein